MLTPQERYTLEMALFYRKIGLNPIPSAIDAKRPMYAFAADGGWENPLPAGWFTEEAWERRPTTNVQIMTGRRWRLLVIDLDGEEAEREFRRWGRIPTTWATHRDGGGSKHLWFRLPAGYPKKLPKAFLWRHPDESVRHVAIERLGDHSLIVAPPSFHVEHRDSQYRFIDDRHSYRGMAFPAECPRWLLDRRPITPEPHAPEFVPPRPRAMTRAASPEAFMDRNELLDRLGDKVAIAREWGLRFTGRVSPTGWAECHSIRRPDSHPSAALHVETGVYKDQGNGETLPFFDLMRATNNAIDFRDACARLAARI